MVNQVVPDPPTRQTSAVGFTGLLLSPRAPDYPPLRFGLRFSLMLDPIQSALAALTLRSVERGPLRRYAGGQARA